MTNSHSQNSKPVIYACSGCSDAGELADRIARRLTLDDLGRMSCLAGVAGRVRHLLAVAKNAEKILVIDGCTVNCASRTLEHAGVTRFTHLALHEMGLHKGHCPVTDANIARGVVAAHEKLQEPPDA